MSPDCTVAFRVHPSIATTAVFTNGLDIEQKGVLTSQMTDWHARGNERRVAHCDKIGRNGNTWG